MNLILVGKIMGVLCVGTTLAASAYFIPKTSSTPETGTEQGMKEPVKDAYIYANIKTPSDTNISNLDPTSENFQCNTKTAQFDCEISTLASNSTNQYKVGKLEQTQLNPTTEADFTTTTKKFFQIKFDGHKNWNSLSANHTEITIKSKTSATGGEQKSSTFTISCAVYGEQKLFTESSLYFIAKVTSISTVVPAPKNGATDSRSSQCTFNNETGPLNCSIFSFAPTIPSDDDSKTYDQLSFTGGGNPMLEHTKENHYYLIQDTSTPNNQHLESTTIAATVNDQTTNFKIEGRAMHDRASTDKQIFVL